MKTLFDQADRESIRHRLAVLQPDGKPLWGKMNAAQMVTHCARALETGTGDRPMKQGLSRQNHHALHPLVDPRRKTIQQELAHRSIVRRIR